MRLANRCALITGGGTGLGLGIARSFVGQGARVAIAGRRRHVLEEAAIGIGPDVLVVPADASDEAQMRAAVDAVVARFGRLDILVHSAGVQVARTDLLDTELDAFEATLRGNLTSAFIASREAARVMPAAGSIVLVGSVAGLIGTPQRLSYTAAKSGMVGLVSQAVRALGARGIRINLIAPGYVPTAMTADVLGGLSGEERERVLDAYPLHRLGEVKDIANAAVYLASDEASWVTGVILPVDGGFRAEKVV